MNKTWYFTFGCGQKNAGKVQPIEAQTASQARAEMMRIWGLKWCAQYSTSDWNRIKKEAASHGYEVEKELATITLTGEGETVECM